MRIYLISFIALLFASCSNPILPITDLEEQKLKGKVYKIITIENVFDTIFETFNENGYFLRQIIRDSNGLYSDWQNYYNKSCIKYKSINHFGSIEDSVHFKFNDEGNFKEVTNFQGKDIVNSIWTYDEKGDESVIIMSVNGEPKSRWDFDVTDSTFESEIYSYELQISRKSNIRFNKKKQIVKSWDDHNKLTSYQYLKGTDLIKATSEEIDFDGIKEINTNYFYELDKDSNWISETEIINYIFEKEDSIKTEINNSTRIIEYYKEVIK